MIMKLEKPEIGDVILVDWPGHDGPKEFAIGSVRDDEDGVSCVVFGEGSTIGAEAVADLELIGGVWIVVKGENA
jgi:hypothetical protein